MSDEIKMFIAGEEVVSQNEFTINEEMLSASSTILNNCYPKSWELTKDYTSNFYYPKDYSKFLLGEGEFLHGIEEYAPLEITGTNLFDGVWELGIYNGTTGAKVNNSSQMRCANFIPVKELTNYKFSIDNTNVTAMYVYEYKEDYTYNLTVNKVIYLDSYLTTNENTKYITFRPNNNIIDLQAKVQLQEGTQATNFENYYQPNLSYETNVEKEINTFNIYGRTYQATRSGKNKANPSTMAFVNCTYNSSTGVYSANDEDTASSLVMKVQQWSSLTSYLNVPGSQIIKSVSSTGRISFTGGILDGANYIRIGNNGATKEFRIMIPIPSSFTVGTRFTLSFDIIDTTIGAVKLQNIQLEVGNEMTSYEAYGIQPSPEYPSELVSVGYKNIFNITNYENIITSDYGSAVITQTTDKIIAKTASNSNSGFYITKANFISYIDNFNPSKQYYISMDIKANRDIRVLIGSDNRPIIPINNKVQRIVLPTYIVNNGFVVYSQMNTANDIIEVSNIQVAETNNSLYVPYNKYGVEISTTGKNLFDESQLLNVEGWQKNEDGYYYGGRDNLYRKFRYENGGFNFNCKFKENTQYTLKFMVYSSVATGNARFTIRYTDGTVQSTGNWNTTTPIQISRTSLANKTIEYMYFDYGSGGSSINYIKNIQLEEGTIATEYEPYKNNIQLYVLDEPLRAIGNYKDRLYTDGRVLYVERNIGEFVLNGSESYSNQNGQYDTATRMFFSTRIASIEANMTNRQAMSNYFIYSTTNVQSNIDITGFDFNFYAPYSDYLYFKIEKALLPTQDASGFANWVSTHNIVVQYQVASPTITPLGYIDLPISYEGQNNVSIYTGLDTRIELWYYWKNYDVLFAGVVKNSGDISLNPRHPHYCSLQILDYKTFLSESNTLDFVIANKTISEAISMVVNAVSGYGFIVGNIDIDSANDIIGAYSTLNKSAYDVLQYLAEISGSRWRARVVDSLTMAIDFYDPDTLPQAEDIEYTKEYWENNNIVDLTFNYGTRDYRNKQILLSDEVYANINYDETLISNGYSNTFTLQNNIGDVVSVVVDGAEKTIGTNNDKQMGVEADFYFTPGKNVIESNSVYSAGTMIHLTYQPLVKGRQIVYNNSEVDRISQQTQTEGVIARYETRNDVLSSDELEKIAKTYIEYKGKAEVILTLRTQNKDLYNIGEVVYFNAPISDLAQNYMVKSKKTEYVVINKIVNLFYIYELTSSFNSEKAINYFDNQRSKATGNIEEGESITRNVDIETQANIIWSEGSVSSASVTVTGDNVLNCALNSPFVE